MEAVLSPEDKRRNEEYQLYDRLYTEFLKAQFVVNVVIPKCKEIHKKSGSKQEPLITWEKIFPLVGEAIQNLIKSLEIEAKESEKNETDFRFGKVLSENIQFFKAFDYTNHLEKMKDEMILLQSDRNYGEEIKNMETDLKDILINGRTMGSTVKEKDIIKIHSIPEGLSRIVEVTLKLSLAELIKITPKDHVDYNDLTQAAQLLDNISRIKDKNLQNLEGTQYLLRFDKSVQNFFIEKQASRYFHGRALVDGLYGKYDACKYTGYLFSDCIAFSKVKKSALQQVKKTIGISENGKIVITALLKFENINEIKYDNDAISIREPCAFFTVCDCKNAKSYEFKSMDGLYDAITTARDKYFAKDSSRKKPEVTSYGSAITCNRRSSVELPTTSVSETRSSLTRSSSEVNQLCDTFEF